GGGGAGGAARPAAPHPAAPRAPPGGRPAREAALIGRVYPHRPPVTAPKGVLGHCMGAAGAMEAALTVLTLQHGVVPPIANLDAPAAEFDLDCVTKQPLHRRIDRAVSHSFGFGGHNAVLALERA
ncbi:3-oxoacyl-ACP synthase, partial [Streptomyces sp. NPDC059096]